MLTISALGCGALSISPKLTKALFNASQVLRPERRAAIAYASRGSFSKTRNPAAASASATSNPSSIEAAKQLTKRIKSATNPRDLFDTLEAQQDIASVRHLSIALHHLSKMQPLSMKSRKAQLKNHPDIIWLVREILDRKDEQWEDISIANVLEACHTLRIGNDFPKLLAKAEVELVKPRQKPSNWRTVTSILTALAKLGRKMDTHPYLQAVQASLLTLEKKNTIGNTKELSQLDMKIRLEDFQDSWGLAWALTELECSSKLADVVVSHVSTNQKFKTLTPRQLIFITRLAAERGSSQRALPTAQDVATALTCGRWEAALKSPTPRVSARDLAMLFFNLAKLVRMAASTDLNSEIDPAMWHKMEQRVTQIDGSTPDLQSAIRLLQRALVPLVETMEAHEVSSVASALAQMQRTKSALVPMLAARATELAPTMDSMGLCMIARALASLQFDSEPFIEAAAIALRKHLLLSSSAHGSGGGNGPGNSSLKKKHQQASHSLPPPPSIQGLIAMLYSLAVLDRCDGPAVQKLLPELIARLIPALSELDPIESNYLPLVGWSLMVAKGSPLTGDGSNNETTSSSIRNRNRANFLILQALRAWRSAITVAGHRIPPRQLAMVQHVDVALRIECPDLGTDAPAQYDAFFNSLYDSGRLRFRAGAEWAAQKDRVLDNGTSGGTGNELISSNTSSTSSIDTDSEDNNKYGYQKHGSRFQREVYSALCQAIIPPPLESSSSSMGIISRAWEFEYWEHNLWYPVDAALPAYKLAIEADGPTHYATTTLRPLGHTLLKRRLLKQLGWVVVNIPLFEWIDIDSSGDTREAYLVRKVDTALGGMKIDEFLKTVVVEEAAEAAAEENSGAEVNNQASEEIIAGEQEVPDATLLVNRALRLDLMKMRQGKLSKSQLAFNAAMRNTNSGSNSTGTGSVPLKKKGN
jgi:RAP domain